MKTDAYDSWYESVRHELSGAGIWLKGGEINTLSRQEYETRSYRILITRLSSWLDVQESATHSILYSLAASVEGLFPDLAFLPSKQDYKIMVRDNIPLLLGANTKQGPAGFDLIAFSNSIVQELINIPAFLKTSGISLSKKERMSDEQIPLIILGGANAVNSTVLWCDDPPIDAVFIGESYMMIKKLFSLCMNGKKEKIPKIELLNLIKQEIDGIILPDKPEKTIKRGNDNTEINTQASGLISYYPPQTGAGSLFISEGCRAICSFCSESWLRKPYREYSYKLLIEQAKEIKARMGLSRIDLFSFNFNMYTDFYELMWQLAHIYIKIGLKSQRIEMLGIDPMMIDIEQAAGKNSFSCGLEGISERLRKYLNKNIDINLVIATVTLMIRKKVKELKIFIIATGLEQESDYIEWEKFLSMLVRLKNTHASSIRIILSITPLVRFPWTPLESAAAPMPEVYDDIILLINEIAQRNGLECRAAMETGEYMVSQLLARATDKRLWPILLSVIEQTGFIYGRRMDKTFLSTLTRAFEKNGISIASLLQGADNHMPWHLIETGINKELLTDIYTNNCIFDETGKPYTKSIIKPSSHLEQEFKKLLTAKQREKTPIRFKMNVYEKASGLSRKYLATALARAIMLTNPNLTSAYIGTGISMDSRDDIEKQSYSTGDDIIELYWEPGAAAAIESMFDDKTGIEKINSFMCGFGEASKIWHGDYPINYSITVETSYRFEPSIYLKKRGLNHVLKKPNPGKSVYELSKEALRKKIITNLYTESGKIYLNVAARFNWDEFLSECFPVDKSLLMRIKSVIIIE